MRVVVAVDRVSVINAQWDTGDVPRNIVVEKLLNPVSRRAVVSTIDVSLQVAR